MLSVVLSFTWTNLFKISVVWIEYSPVYYLLWKPELLWDSLKIQNILGQWQQIILSIGWSHAIFEAYLSTELFVFFH